VRNASGARWEIKCAASEGVPVLGVYISRNDLYKPPEIVGRRIIYWTWDGIGNWIAKR
jgi:hypothetical protein